jgi:DNA-binding response OmpR family regulator
VSAAVHHHLNVNTSTATHPQNSFDQGGRILVIEPEPELASKIHAALREAAPAAQADLARNIEEAMRLVVSNRPDLFVLDVDAVPDLSRDFLFDLRTSHPNARAIVLTGHQMAFHREQAAGLGAIHFLEKPFPHGDFVDLVQALLSPSNEPDSEKFQGTLSDLHLADIIQLKCMSGASAALQFTGPQGEKARVYFDSGQVRHAVAPGKEGIPAFNEIVNWKGGQISEVSGAPNCPRTIDLDWQILLMEAVRKMDENKDKRSASRKMARPGNARRKILVIDDSLMLLSFVKEILAEANYQVAPAATAEEGLVSATEEVPDLILLDYVLPDMKGDEVCRHLSQNPITVGVPIVYMSGFGADLKHDKLSSGNVIGLLNKPFTSDLLLKTVEKYLPKDEAEPEPVAPEPPPMPRTTEEPWAAYEPTAPVAEPEPIRIESGWQTPESGVGEPVFQPEPIEAQAPPPSIIEESTEISAGVGATDDSWWSAPVSQPAPTPEQPVWADQQPSVTVPTFESPMPASLITTRSETPLSAQGVFFAGDTSFFSLNCALQTIGKEKLTGTLRLFWDHEPVELLSRNGEIILVTTNDPQLYCPEAPITLVNVDAEKAEEARAQQRETGCPVFLTLAQKNLIVRDPAIQLVQHYGQKLFVQLWTAPRVRFEFNQSDTLPDYCQDVPTEGDIDHWILTTLRSVQLQELETNGDFDAGDIPAYTRAGFDRVQTLRLTAAEAQFASQFNGARSIAQIARNLRLDLKFARLTLFRFIALEVVECWPPTPVAKPEKGGFLKAIGFGE